MILYDEPTIQPPDSREIIDDDFEKEKTTKKKSINFDIPNNTSPFTKNVTTSEGNKNEEKRREIEIITSKYPKLPAETYKTMTKRTTEIATVVVIINNRNTIPVTLQLRTFKGSTNLNVLRAYNNIFSAMKLIDSTLKWITLQKNN